jgi:two-component sensor histidine kinase
MEWKERGGPVVATPSRRGFGSRVIAHAFARDQGAVEHAFEPDGVRCTFRLQLP